MTNPTPTRPVMPTPDENLLKSVPPPAFKPTGVSVEMRALEQTLALLNNTNITGAKLPAEEREATKVMIAGSVTAPAVSIPAGPPLGVVQLISPAPVAAPTTVENDPGETRAFADPVHTPDPIIAAPTPTPPPARLAPAPLRIILTGRTGVGKDYLAGLIPGAHVLNLDTPIWTWIRQWFSDGPASGIFPAVATIKAWGSGIVSEKCPITPARLLFIMQARGVDGWSAFGTPAFWAKLAVDTADQILAQTSRQVIVSGIETAQEFAALAEAGFRHYHVVTSSSTYAGRVKRPNANDSFSAALDQNVTKEISQNRTGRLLRCIWNDMMASPSSRLMSIETWKKEVTLNESPQTGE